MRLSYGVFPGFFGLVGFVGCFYEAFRKYSSCFMSFWIVVVVCVRSTRGVDGLIIDFGEELMFSLLF